MVLGPLLLTCAAILMAPSVALAAEVPADTTLDRLQGLRLSRARVLDGARTVVLRRPEFTASGIGFEKAEGFPRPRPALIAGSDWDSIPPPPNPVRWERIGRVEQPTPAGLGFAGFLGGVAGFVVGYGAIQVMSSESDWTVGQVTAVSIGSGIVGAVLGGWVAHHLFGPEPGWRTVYAP